MTLKTNTIRIRPEVIRAAPIQSTRLSSSVDGSSSSMAKIPKAKHAKVNPDNKYKGLLHVGLQTRSSSNKNRFTRTNFAFAPHLVNCVRTLLSIVLKADPTGAPAEKVAKAMEREDPGGNALDKIPS